MSLIAEFNAEHNARALAKVLCAALDTKNEDVIAFCATHVAPLYHLELSESFGAGADPRASRMFPFK